MRWRPSVGRRCNDDFFGAFVHSSRWRNPCLVRSHTPLPSTSVTVDLSLVNRHLNDAFVAKHGTSSSAAVEKAALAANLKGAGCEFLDKDIDSGRVDVLRGPVVLQIDQTKNISAPSDNQSSQGAPRLLRLRLTDGHRKVSALELEQVPGLSLQTPPGTKILLQDAETPVRGGFVMLGPGTRVLGGHVSSWHWVPLAGLYS